MDYKQPSIPCFLDRDRGKEAILSDRMNQFGQAMVSLRGLHGIVQKKGLTAKIDFIYFDRLETERDTAHVSSYLLVIRDEK
jgi:hypothetical protein